MNSIIVAGRLVSPTQIELSMPVNLPNSSVQVEIHVPQLPVNQETVIKYLEELAASPSRGRSKADIDEQIREERDGWESGR